LPALPGRLKTRAQIPAGPAEQHSVRHATSAAAYRPAGAGSRSRARGTWPREGARGGEVAAAGTGGGRRWRPVPLGRHLNPLVPGPSSNKRSAIRKTWQPHPARPQPAGQAVPGAGTFPDRFEPPGTPAPAAPRRQATRHRPAPYLGVSASSRHRHALGSQAGFALYRRPAQDGKSRWIAPSMVSTALFRFQRNDSLRWR
jgi:hypothetical protein